MEKTNETHNGWNEYKRDVLSKLNRVEDQCEKIDLKIDTKFEKLEEKIDKISKKVTILEVKAAIYGLAAAILVTAILQLIIKYA